MCSLTNQLCRTLFLRNIRLMGTAADATYISTLDGPIASLPNDKSRQLSPKLRELIDQIVGLSMLEVSDLNFHLKKRLNIPDTPSFPAGMMMAPAPSETIAKETVQDTTPQKTSFAVKLLKFDDKQKISLIKEIRNHLPGINLVQAKKFVESAPVEVKNDLGKNEADAIKLALEKLGATCEIL